MTGGEWSRPFTKRRKCSYRCASDPNAKISAVFAKEVVEIWKLKAEGKSIVEISLILNPSKSRICSVLQRRK